MTLVANCDQGVIVAKDIVPRSIVCGQDVNELPPRSCQIMPSERGLLYVFTSVARLIRAQICRPLPKVTSGASQYPQNEWIRLVNKSDESHAPGRGSLRSTNRGGR